MSAYLTYLVPVGLLLAAAALLWFLNHGGPTMKKALLFALVLLPMPAQAVTFSAVDIVAIDLTTNPVVVIGTRVIDFTPNMGQEFIAFQPAVRADQGSYIFTLGIRARDGLASISGALPLSWLPGITNAIPLFQVGTTDLLLFELAIQGDNVRFPLTTIDLDGDAHVANFQSPAPEPATLLLFGTILAGLGWRWKKGKGMTNTRLEGIQITPNTWHSSDQWSFHPFGWTMIDCWLTGWEERVDIAHAEAIDYDVARSWARWAAQNWRAGELPTRRHANE